MRRTAPVPLAAFTALACTCALAGCYQKVVGVNGPASKSYNVEEASIGRNESVWSTEKPRPIEQDRYSGGTTVDSARQLPTKKPNPATQP